MKKKPSKVSRVWRTFLKVDSSLLKERVFERILENNVRPSPTLISPWIEPGRTL